MTSVVGALTGYHGVYALFAATVGLLVVLAAAQAAWDAYVDQRRLRGLFLGAALGAAAADGSPPAFVCPDCGARSWHPDDGRYGWCGRCHSFTGRPHGLDVPTDNPHRRPA